MGHGKGGCEGGAKLYNPLSLLGITFTVGCFLSMSVRRIVPGEIVLCVKSAWCLTAGSLMIHVLHRGLHSAV